MGSKTLQAYLLTYWPEPGQLSRTVIDYSQIEINFDENKIEDEIFRWEYKIIETLKINMPVQNVADRLSEVNTKVRENLAKKNKLDLEHKLDAQCFMEIDNASQLMGAVKKVCNDLLLKYAKVTPSKNNPAN